MIERLFSAISVFHTEAENNLSSIFTLAISDTLNIQGVP
jgi:hypothetical protein